jgi:hypothetical protein
MTERVETMWCTDCGGCFTDDEVKGGLGCPECDSQGIPCGVDQDVRVEVNWHELRILGIWAENYARACAAKSPNPHDTSGGGMPCMVAAITRRLQRQFPDFPPLTLSQEIFELPAALEKASIEIGAVETNVPRPEPIPVNGPGAVGHTRAR